MGVREVGALLNESAQADAVGHGRPVEGIPAINGGEDVNSQCQAIVAAVQQLASSIETVAIEVQESFSAKDAESQKLKQLQQLLKGLV